eukprot:TRINITY_DN18459_c0_g1_i2.p1 TRINITY_DN18459_c0_g1~~TRINITY_DN18459_c0_g1_i2.p1  ORF type:complete len:224 (-),score=16.10 TRINITY_DN18459_c0_g1_i2:59-697(-)
MAAAAAAAATGGATASGSNTTLCSPHVSSMQFSHFSAPESGGGSSSAHCLLLPLASPPPLALVSITTLDSLNEWLNVLQSVELPFAVVPLLAVASSTHVMGRHALKGWLKVASWASAIVIVVVNLYLVADFSQGNLPQTFPVRLLVVGATAIYLFVILYLAFCPRSETSEFNPPPRSTHHEPLRGDIAGGGCREVLAQGLEEPLLADASKAP